MCLNPFVACVPDGEPMGQAGARQEPRGIDEGVEFSGRIHAAYLSFMILDTLSLIYSR